MKGSTVAFSSLGAASVASGVLVSFLPLYVFGITRSDFLAASIAAVPSVAAIITSPLWGALKDRSANSMPLMLVGVLPYAAVSFFLVFVSDVTGIFAGWLLASVFISSTTPVFAAIVTARGEGRGASIGLLAASSAFGGGVGAIVGGITYQWYDLRIAFLSGGLSAVVAGLMILFLFKDDSHATDSTTQSGGRITTLKVLQNFDVLKPCISCFSYMVGITAFYALASIYVVEILGGSRLLWGVSATLAYVIGAVAIAPIGRLSDRIGRKPIIRAGLLAQVVLFISFIFFRNPLFVALLSVVPLGFIVCNTITTLVTDVTTEQQRGKAVGIQYSFLNSGGVVGPLAGGAIAQEFGFGFVLVFAIVSVLFSFLWLQRKVDDKSAPAKLLRWVKKENCAEA